MQNGWESLYVYDIACRAKRLLESHTAARVVATTRDGGDFEIADVDVLPASRGHAVLTTPPYPIEDPAVGVHLRWYLANSIYRKAMQQAAAIPRRWSSSRSTPTRSIPSLRGAMAYIPAAAHARRQLRQERRRSTPCARSSRRARGSPSPGSSGSRARASRAPSPSRSSPPSRTAGLPVHPFKPVRDKIIRDGREWVPAVLRYNTVPAKMLLEVCNLNNPDRRLLQTRAYRQQVAEAIVRRASSATTARASPSPRPRSPRRSSLASGLKGRSTGSEGRSPGAGRRVLGFWIRIRDPRSASFQHPRIPPGLRPSLRYDGPLGLKR